MAQRSERIPEMAVSRWPAWMVSAYSNRFSANIFAAGVGTKGSATLEVRGHKTGRKVSLPVVVADYQGDRYLVSMLGQNANWVRNLRTDNRAGVLRRYLELAPGARPFFPVDRRAPLSDFERIVDDYPVFQIARKSQPS